MYTTQYFLNSGMLFVFDQKLLLCNGMLSGNLVRPGRGILADHEVCQIPRPRTNERSKEMIRSPHMVVITTWCCSIVIFLTWLTMDY